MVDQLDTVAEDLSCGEVLQALDASVALVAEREGDTEVAHLDEDHRGFHLGHQVDEEALKQTNWLTH